MAFGDKRKNLYFHLINKKPRKKAKINKQKVTSKFKGPYF